MPVNKVVHTGVSRKDTPISVTELVSATGAGVLAFGAFVKVVGHFLEDQDEEAMLKELKEAFRLYDKEGMSYI